MDANEWTILVTGLLTGLGIGAAVTAYVQHLLKKQEYIYQSQREDLEKRYKVIILLMYAAFNFEENKTTLRIHRPDLDCQADVLDELKAEWYNMLLFASKETINALYVFIQHPNLKNLKMAAIYMRKDLGRGDLGETISELEFK